MFDPQGFLATVGARQKLLRSAKGLQNLLSGDPASYFLIQQAGEAQGQIQTSKEAVIAILARYSLVRHA